MSGALVGAALLALAAAPADAAAKHAVKPWTTTTELRLSPHQLGLGASASPVRVARAALSRSANRLGLPRSLAGVRLESDRRDAPGPRGGVALHTLRFRQTSGGRRVLWSDITVTIGGRDVRSITATVVPVKAGRPAVRPRVGAARALEIAHRAVPGREAASAPSLLTFAGDPAHGRAPRLAYVVETLGAVATGDDAPTGICVVLDARTGKLLTTWKGSAAPAAVDVHPGSATPRAVPAVRRSVTLQVDDAQRPAPPPTSQDPPRYGYEIGSPYGRWAATGSVGVPARSPAYTLANWDTAPLAPLSASPQFNSALDAVLRNTRDAVTHMCFSGDFCSDAGRSRSNGVTWPIFTITGNNPDPSGNSFYLSFLHRVFLTPASGYSNDVVAHELGHLVDFTRSSDRRFADNQAEEVREGIADMFAYDLDREDATLGEDGPAGKNTRTPTRNWATSILSQPFRMADYRCGAEIHFNSTILSHAYYSFVQEVGADVAGHVLYLVPGAVGTNGTFVNVADKFVSQAAASYPNTPQVAAAARQAFVVEGGMSQGPRSCSVTAPPPVPVPVPEPVPAPAPAPVPVPVPDVAVPDVRGGTPGAAATALSAAGLHLGSQRAVVDPTCNDIGTVLGQVPSPGTVVAPGSLVNISIGARPAPPRQCA